MSAIIIFRDDTAWFMNTTAFNDLMNTCIDMSDAPITPKFRTAVANNGLVLLRTDVDEYKVILDVLLAAIPIVQDRWNKALERDQPSYSKEQALYNINRATSLAEKVASVLAVC